MAIKFFILLQCDFFLFVSKILIQMITDSDFEEPREELTSELGWNEKPYTPINNFEVKFRWCLICLLK